MCEWIVVHHFSALTSKFSSCIEPKYDLDFSSYHIGIHCKLGINPIIPSHGSAWDIVSTEPEQWPVESTPPLKGHKTNFWEAHYNIISIPQSTILTCFTLVHHRLALLHFTSGEVSYVTYLQLMYARERAQTLPRGLNGLGRTTFDMQMPCVVVRPSPLSPRGSVCAPPRAFINWRKRSKIPPQR